MTLRKKMLMSAAAVLTVAGVSTAAIVNANAGTTSPKAPAAVAADLSHASRGNSGALVFPGSNGAEDKRCEIAAYAPTIYNGNIQGEGLIYCPEVPFEMTLTVKLVVNGFAFDDRATNYDIAPIGGAFLDLYTTEFGCYSAVFQTYMYATARFADENVVRTGELVTESYEALC